MRCLKSLELNLVVRTESEKEWDPWHKAVPAGRRRGDVVQNMCNDCALQSLLKQGITSTCSTRNRAAQDILFD